MQSMAEYGWLFIFLAGLILFHWERIPRPEPGSAAAWTAAVVAVVALLHQEPFLDFKELASGRLAEVQWARAPSLFSVTEWMQHCLNPHSVIYGYYMQRWTLPGSVLPPDDPLLESIHRPGAPWIRVMETLRQLGVDFILDYHGDPELEAYTVYQHDPVLARLGDRHFFQPVVKGSSMALYRVIYPGGALPRRPDRSNPMPWLFDFAAGGPMPPHDALSFPLVSR
jgi:hypothetical protein